jgi:hypothetical protein
MCGPCFRRRLAAGLPVGESARLETEDCARRRSSRGPRWSSSAGAWAPLRQAEPVQSYRLPPVCSLWEKLTREGSIMEQLEIVDLGDAMTETRCSMAIGPQFDFLYGAGHWRC